MVVHKVKYLIGVVAAILFQGLVTGCFGFVVWNVLWQRYGAVSLHTFMLIMLVVGVLLGGLLLEEMITGNNLIALVLIGTGMLVTQFSRTVGDALGEGRK